MVQLGLVIAGLALLAGCTVGPGYHKPTIATPPAYSQAPTNAAPVSTNQPDTLARWWTVFEDPELESLIDRAMRNNRDLRQAASRVRQARAQRGVVAAGLLPEIDATAGFSDSRGSQNVSLPFGAGAASAATGGSGGAQKARVSPHRLQAAGGQSARIPATAPLGGPESPLGLGGLPGAESDIYQVGLQTSWEIDVWGGTRRSIEAAWAEFAASEEGQRAARIALLSEMATNYIALRQAQERLQIARDTEKAQGETLAIIHARFTNGLSTELDYQQQLAELAATRATMPPLETRASETRHALAFLIAADPASLDAELAEPRRLPSPAPPPMGLPSDLLRRRPDVRQAERMVAAANAQIGAATADLFPKFSLTGAVGMDSSRAENLIEWPSRYFAFSPGVSWPILDWGRIHNNIKVQDELHAQALLAYENTVALAVRQVEDALAAYGHELAHRADLADAAEASRRALELARGRYDKGLADFLTVLTSERSLLATQDSLAQSDAAIRSGLVKLYVALGGGWEPSHSVK